MRITTDGGKSPVDDDPLVGKPPEEYPPPDEYPPPEEYPPPDEYPPGVYPPGVAIRAPHEGQANAPGWTT